MALEGSPLGESLRKSVEAQAKAHGRTMDPVHTRESTTTLRSVKQHDG